MRDLLTPTAQRLQEFLESRRHVGLVLRSPAEDALAILKLIEGLENQSVSDLFWTCTHPFVDAESYVEQVVDEFSAKHSAVQISMQQESMDAWPNLPEEVTNSEGSPVARLRALTQFSRELLPIPLGGYNFWSFYPLEIVDHHAFARFAFEFIQHELPNPWCHHLRFLFREAPAFHGLSRSVAGDSRFDVHEPDLTAGKLRESLDQEIEDESMPLDQRINSVLVSAGLDQAHGNFEDAIDKYGLAFQHHAASKNLAMAAVALNGMGEVFVRLEEYDQANEAFQSALVPASESDPPAYGVWQNIAINLANLRMHQRDWPQAAGYWDVVTNLAVLNRDAGMKIRALDQRGYCEYKQNDREAAELSWQASVNLSREVGDPELEAILQSRRMALEAENSSELPGDGFGGNR